MTTAQEAVYARREAVDNLERLLHTPESLRNLSVLLEEYQSERQTTKDQLSATLVAHMNDLRSGLESLERAQESLMAFETRFASVEALCADCASLVDCHQGIRRLGAVHSNVRQTLHSAEAVATLPTQAADAEKLLTSSNDSAAGLIRAYMALAELEATVVRVQHALDAFKEQSPAARLQVPSLEFYFTQVDKAMTKVEERVWSTIRSFQSIARTNPAMLVAALQVIEVQENVDRELLAAGQGGSKLRKGMRARCMQQLAASIQESFAPLLQKSSKLLADDSAVEELLRSVLQEASKLVDELKIVRDYVVPCFPPHYSVLHAVCAEVHSQISNILDLIGLSASRLSNGDVIFCVRWVDEYHAKMKNLKQSIESLNGAAGAAGFDGVSLLLDTYVDRVATTLESWLNNIVENDFRGEPSVAQDGKLWTPGPVDLFRILDEQLGVAAPAGGILVKRVATEAGRMLRSFQKSTRSKLTATSHPLEVLCAVANNSHRCNTLGLEFLNRVKDLHLGTENESDIKEACDSFLDVGEVAIACCVEAVFGDPGFVELFSMVGHSDGWLNGTVTGSVLATLDDFMNDFDVWLQPTLIKRLADRLLIESISHFVAAITMQLKAVRDEDLKALRRDVAKIKSFFGSLVSPARSEQECQPLEDIIEFVAADSVEAFVLSYTTLLETAPGISPVLLSNLLAARVASGEDMTKADAKEVMEGCRQVFAGKKQTAGAGGGSEGVSGSGGILKGRGLPGNRDAAFLAALNAARRRPERGGTGGK